MADNYNNTLNLPKTDFSMRAGLPAKEPEMLDNWRNNGLYEKMLAANQGKPLYILHDGPPFANNSIHMGTALNKVLKDIIVRFKNMSGFQAPFVPGWDCHGLPIERMALQKVGKDRKNVSDYELREICHDFAMHYMDVQRKEFIRLGSLGDYEHPYLTLAPDFEANQIAVFGEMAKKGYIYKGLKPVYWCPVDHTALAEAEIEYEDDHVDSIYVAFAVAKDNGALAKAGVPASQTSVVIWTTTTWTLPGNVAICLGPKYEYVAAKVGEKYYIVAKDLAEKALADCGITNYEVAATFSGSELERMECAHPWLDRRSLVVVGDHVTLESGTGAVHTAPGHGLEDYDVIVRHYPELPMIVPVDDGGKLTVEAGEQFAGLSVFKANKPIEALLAERGNLLGRQHMEHSYPHCWRCHSPVIFRATEQWFCSVEDFKADTYKAVEEIKWIPAWGQERMAGMVRDRADWCVSRQRLWGVPIPVFYCDDCEAYLINEETVGAVQKLFAAEGSNAWFKYSADEILPAGTKCPKCGGTHWHKEKDTMDVWFDSGTSYATVLGPHSPWPNHPFPADLYIEGSDQYRGWFQSSLLTSVASRGVAPYKRVVSCGWVVDGEGRKMSKSLGNGIAPEEIIRDYGADIIRLWAAASDYQVDVRISKDILKQLTEGYRKIRNTARFILGNLYDFEPDVHSVANEAFSDLDCWALDELDKLIHTCRDGYENFDFHKVYHSLHRFCVVTMSNLYLDIIKDRIYVNQADSPVRRAAQTAMFRILLAITQLLAPILAFTSQEIWGFVPDFEGKQPYVVMHDMPTGSGLTLGEEKRRYWETLIAVAGDAKKVLEALRVDKVIGSPMEARVVLHCNDLLYEMLSAIPKELEDIFIVSHVDIVRGGHGTPGEVEGLEIEAMRAEGEKCQRCWLYRPEVGSHPTHDTLCARCAEIIESM